MRWMGADIGVCAGFTVANQLSQARDLGNGSNYLFDSVPVFICVHLRASVVPLLNLTKTKEPPGIARRLCVTDDYRLMSRPRSGLLVRCSFRMSAHGCLFAVKLSSYTV